MELRDVKFKEESEMMKARIRESGGTYICTWHAGRANKFEESDGFANVEWRSSKLPQSLDTRRRESRPPLIWWFNCKTLSIKSRVFLILTEELDLLTSFEKMEDPIDSWDNRSLILKLRSLQWTRISWCCVRKPSQSYALYRAGSRFWFRAVVLTTQHE